MPPVTSTRAYGIPRDMPAGWFCCRCTRRRGTNRQDRMSLSDGRCLTPACGHAACTYCVVANDRGEQLWPWRLDDAVREASRGRPVGGSLSSRRFRPAGWRCHQCDGELPWGVSSCGAASRHPLTGRAHEPCEMCYAFNTWPTPHSHEVIFSLGREGFEAQLSMWDLSDDGWNSAYGFPDGAFQGPAETVFVDSSDSS